MSAQAHEQPLPLPSPRTRRSPRWIGWLGALTLAASLTGAGWTAAAYVGLVRLHVQWVDSCARVEAAGRAHLALVDNLLHVLPAGAFDSELRDGIRAARRRAGATSFEPAVVEDRARAYAFRSAHGELGRALAGFWEWAERGNDREVRVELWGLEDRLERAQARLAQALDAVEDSAGAYRVASAGFPAFLVASFAATPGR